MMQFIASRLALATTALSLALLSSAARADNLTALSVSLDARAVVSGGALEFTHAKPQAGATPAQKSTSLRTGGRVQAFAAGQAASSRPRYPADLINNGGPVIPSAVHHTIFVNTSASCPPNACWGDPIGFLRDLNNSDFIHVTDQYVGTTADGRYPVGQNYVINYPVTPGVPLTNLDVAIIAYSAARFSGNFDFGHIYSVFLPPGQDLCFDSTFSTCYSPDNFNSFAFCAYHSSVNTSLGRVIFTAEPYQAVDGCSVRPGTPNGVLADSTNSVLSHEVFETITDPRGNAWWNSINNGIFGEEIGDECSFLTFTATNVYFDPSNVVLNGKLYSVQPEYSNVGHVCQVRRSDS